MRVEATDLEVDLGGTPVVRGGRLVAEPGSVVGLIGPNGSGKSTLLRAIHRVLRPRCGAVLVGGEDVWRLTPRQSARRTAVVLQDDTTDFDFTVREAVELGRVPHHGLLQRTGDEDRDAIDDALRTAGVAHLADRLVPTLSGGERQRVHVARALAQRTPVVVLDEPTNHLDVRWQIDLLELLTALPVTVVCALHDLNLAAAYCDRLFLVDRGRVVCDGTPQEVLTPGRLAEVYGVRATPTVNPLTGRFALHVAPITTNGAP